MEILSLVLLLVGVLVTLVCLIWFIVLGFRRHWIWGLGLFVPFAVLISMVIAAPETKALRLTNEALLLTGLVIYLCFMVAAWSATKPPSFWSLTGVALLAALAVMVFSGAAALRPELAGVLDRQGWLEPLLKTRLSPPAPGEPGSRGPLERLLSHATPAPSPSEPPPTVFQSHLPPPGPADQPEPAQPGVFYLLERVTKNSARGVQAGLPGERVLLLERLKGDKMRVTLGDAKEPIDLIVHKSQVTADFNAARAAEREEFFLHGGKL